MDEATPSAEDQERLRENAALLIRREREVFALRAKHEQVTRWLKLAQALPALLTDRHQSKLEMFAHLRRSLLSGLRLQRVAFLEIGDQVLTSLAPAGPDRSLGDQVASLLEARPSGFCNEPADPDAGALASAIGLARFVWSRIRLSGKPAVLLVAGYDQSKIAFQPLFDAADAAHIENTAQHIEALLGNAFLVSELERDRDHLQRTNVELETRDRELLVATEQLRTANENLEQRVRARTEDLAQRSRDMRLVLDNVGQALLTVDAGGRLAQERSAALDRWFGPYDGQPLFCDYIARIDAAFAQEFSLGYEALVEGFLPRELTLDQLPRRLRTERREFSCTYLPLLEGEALTGLLIVIDDVTEKTLRDRDAAEQNELLALFQALMHDRSGFVAFIEETQGMLDRLRGQAVDPAERRALLHTLKGTGAVMGASVIAALCHRAENELAEGSADEVRATITRLSERWVDIMQSMSAVIELHGHGAVEVLTGELDRLSEEVRQGASEQHILERLALWRLEPVERPLARLGRHAHALAKRLGKGPISVNVESFDVWTDPRQLGNFWSALIHVVRNAVDHGLEPHDVREASGKSPEGHLAFRARTDDRHLIIEIADDGRGIDWDSVRRVALERGLAHDRPEDLLQALLVPGFSTRTAVTDTSGRGVGMSAVHDQVRRLGGVIALQSVPGLGTRWSFSFPHTAAHGAMLAPLRLSTARQPIPLPSD